MYGPRGVFYDGKHLVVADTGNHRVMIWFSLPEVDHASADVVLGQKDFYSDSPNAGGDPIRGMYMPCGVWIKDGMLFVADSWNHRVLFWERIPEENFKAPDGVIGQDSLENTDPAKGEDVSANRFFWCYGVGFWKEGFFVCDTGNRRVMCWRELPEGNREADTVLRGFMWPHSLVWHRDLLFVADAGNHRVVGIKEPFGEANTKVVLGQKDNQEVVDWSGLPQNERTLRFPYGVSANRDILAVADTTNNRVLLWRNIPSEGFFLPADSVLGQDDFSRVGENKLKGVFKDTLCWPYGVHLWGNYIFVADTGNNRITVWSLRAGI